MKFTLKNLSLIAIILWAFCGVFCSGIDNDIVDLLADIEGLSDAELSSKIDSIVLRRRRHENAQSNADSGKTSVEKIDGEGNMISKRLTNNELKNANPSSEDEAHRVAPRRCQKLKSSETLHKTIRTERKADDIRRIYKDEELAVAEKRAGSDSIHGSAKEVNSEKLAPNVDEQVIKRKVSETSENSDIKNRNARDVSQNENIQIKDTLNGFEKRDQTLGEGANQHVAEDEYISYYDDDNEIGEEVDPVRERRNDELSDKVITAKGQEASINKEEKIKKRESEHMYKFARDSAENSEQAALNSDYNNGIDSGRNLKSDNKKFDFKDMSKKSIAKAHHYTFDRGEINEKGDFKRRFTRLKNGVKRHGLYNRRKRGNAYEKAADVDASLEGGDRNLRVAEKEEIIKSVRNADGTKISENGENQMVDGVPLKGEVNLNPKTNQALEDVINSPSKRSGNTAEVENHETKSSLAEKSESGERLLNVPESEEKKKKRSFDRISIAPVKDHDGSYDRSQRHARFNDEKKYDDNRKRRNSDRFVSRHSEEEILDTGQSSDVEKEQERMSRASKSSGSPRRANSKEDDYYANDYYDGYDDYYNENGMGLESSNVKKREIEGEKEWGPWSDWSPCSKTCGDGEQLKWRLCINGSCLPGDRLVKVLSCFEEDCEESPASSTVVATKSTTDIIEVTTTTAVASHHHHHHHHDGLSDDTCSDYNGNTDYNKRKEEHDADHDVHDEDHDEDHDADDEDHDDHDAHDEDHDPHDEDHDDAYFYNDEP